MNIKILTFHRANNFGATLQSFALKSTIEKLGYKVSFVDYWSFDHRGDYEFIPKFRRSSYRSLFSALIQFFLKIIPITLRRFSFNSFRKQYLIKDNFVIRHKEELRKVSCDLIVLGSDQIWRKSNYNGENQFEWEYFGDFFNPNIPIISYAASMGVISTSKIEIKNIIKRLKKIRKISRR